jgi:Icc protein
MIIAQLSDLHIALTGGSVSAAEAAVAHLLALPARPDLVLISGDCVNNGEPAEYARLRELLCPLPMPVYVVPGNHDQREHLLEAFGEQGVQPLPGFVQYVVDEGPVRVIALDTNVPGSGRGQLCERRLGWLEERLAEAPARPTVVMMHHPPFLTGLAPFDQIGLDGAEALAAIVGRHPQIERIVSGHAHMAITRRFAGTLVIGCPSTTHTLLPDTTRPERLAVLIEPSACLLHVWGEGSGLLTFTSLIGDHGPVVELHDGLRWVA